MEYVNRLALCNAAWKYFAAWVVGRLVVIPKGGVRLLGMIIPLLTLSLFPWGAPALAAEVVQHRLEVSLDPASHRFSARDELSLPAPISGSIRFRLHPGLQPRVSEPGARLRLLGEGAQAERTEEYELVFPEGRHGVRIEYGGEIHHSIAPQGQDYGREMGATSGIIAPEGVFLSGASYWCPEIAGAVVKFELRVHLPPGWRSVSQGLSPPQEAASEHDGEVWRSDQPQEEIYLIAGPFTRYRHPAGPVEAMVFLRSPDPELAQSYLDATSRYLELYRRLLGDYPYGKFALVENFWETGYGMPSFTLLGSKVIRLPFILQSSYPHEILHNWWGNGVYVDAGSGNWSEGLTSYLADHLLREEQGLGADYRRQTLQGYADYVRAGRDFPLTEFRARHSSATQAVGYGKSLMLFHMLRRTLGDETFIAGLRAFYRDHLFQSAGFAELEKSFRQVAGADLTPFFRQWLQRIGAPSLRLVEARTEPTEGGFNLQAVIEQTQDGPPYRLRIPLAISLEGESQVRSWEVELDQVRQKFEIRLPSRPLRLDLDPEFDLFRRLDRREIPPALSQLFGAERVLLVLPAAAPPRLLDAYGQLARRWAEQGGARFEIRLDQELDRLPEDRALWLFGWENRFRLQFVATLAAYPFIDQGNRLLVAGTELVRDQASVALVGRQPGRVDLALGWVATENPLALPGLGRKLPHYGQYSYLGFSGDEPSNRIKGSWPVVDSPLSLVVGQSDGVKVVPIRGRFALRRPLSALPGVK